MKKCLLIMLSLCFCIMLVGCETENIAEVAHISEITGARSTNYAIKMTVDEDDRFTDKYVDLQVKSEKEEQVLKFGRELGDTLTICLPEKDFWYNLTYLISRANGVKSESGYVKSEDFGNRVYNFCADNDVKLTFRVVAGDKKKNEESSEEILVLSERISKEIEVDLKKCVE